MKEKRKRGEGEEKGGKDIRGAREKEKKERRKQARNREEER